jgi:hypothetical protein
VGVTSRVSAAIAIAVVVAGVPAGASAAGQGQGPAVGPEVVSAAIGLPTVVAAGGHATGEGFDTSLAPPASTIRAWSASPYRAVNMYFAGSQRYRTVQPELSPSWVTTVLANGWTIIPTDVDLQAPCSSTPKQKISTNPSTALAQGASAATLAIDDPNPAATSLTQLGLPTGVPVYIDIESYSVPAGNTTCVPAVQAFVRGWIETLHDAGYVAGLYGNPTSAIKDVIAAHAADSSYPQPDAIWFARYDGVDSVDNANIPASYLPHHRIHQYQNSTAYTYGGLTLTIDKDALDGDVVKATSVTLPSGPPYVYAAEVPVGQTLTEHAGPSTGAAATGSYNDGDQLAIECQTVAPTANTAGIVNGDPVWDRLSNGHFVSDIYTTTTGGIDFSPGIPRCDTTPPTVAVTPLAHGTTASSVTVSYRAADPSGVASYDVSWRRARYDRGYGAWQLPASAQKTTATSRTQGLATGYTYCVKVRAYDRAGNLSAWSPQTCTARAIDDRALTAGPRWQRSSFDRFYLGTVTATTRLGATASRADAQVQRVGVVATKCPTCGSVRVSIAGVVVGDIDLHSAVRHRQRLVMLPPIATLRSGKVAIKVTSPPGRLVQLDGMVLSRA